MSTLTLLEVKLRLQVGQLHNTPTALLVLSCALWLPFAKAGAEGASN